jgi:uncharacterized protein with beta-barrel porin domain
MGGRSRHDGYNDALSYAVTNAVTVGVSYSGQYARRASDSAFKGNLEVSF